MPDTIDVWRIRTLRRVGEVDSLRALLPPDEIARSERHMDEMKRRAWVGSRAALRLLLAHYTHVPANEIRFIAGTNGKPHLDSSQNEQGLTFNFSDSGEVALLAVARNREVGADIERIREIVRAGEIALRRLSSEIAAEVRAAGESEKSRIFLQSWARHEAVLKAQAGTIWNPSGNKLNVTVRDLDAGPGYVGALAAQGDEWTVDVKDYTV